MIPEKSFGIDENTGREKKLILSKTIINYKDGFVRHEYDTVLMNANGDGFTLIQGEAVLVEKFTDSISLESAKIAGQNKLQNVTNYEKRHEILN